MDLFGEQSTNKFEFRESRKRENRARRNEAIRARFDALMQVRFEGLGPSYDSVLEKLASEFFMTELSIQTILKGRK